MSCCAKDDSSLSYDDLLRKESKRRELLRRGKRFERMHYFQRWGTVMPAVIRTPEFWLSLAVFLVVRVTMRLGVLSENSDETQVDFGWVSTIGGFISFLLVFYNNQIFGRLVAQYENSMRAEGRIFNAAYLARGLLPPATAWQFVRYLNGAHLLGYVGLSADYSRDNFFLPHNDRLRLFTAEEVSRLDEIGVDGGGCCYREVIGWALDLLGEAHAEQRLDSVLLSGVVAEVLALRGAIGALFDFEDQPIPFMYVHLLHCLVLIYLSLFSFFVAISLPARGSWGHAIALLTVLLNNVFTLGILQIGRLMSEPYGADLCDLSVVHYVNFTLVNSRRILTGKTFARSALEQERSLETERPAMGGGFVVGTMASERYVVSSRSSDGEKKLPATPLSSEKDCSPREHLFSSAGEDSTSDPQLELADMAAVH